MKDIEKKLLAILKTDSRYSIEKIASMIGISARETSEMISKFEEKKVIVKYTTIINLPEEDAPCEAFIEVKVTPQKNRGFDAIAEELMRFKEVTNVYLMSGGFDLTVYIEGKNIREVGLFVSEKLAVLDGVLATGTHFILKKYKIDGENLSECSPEKRIMMV